MIDINEAHQWILNILRKNYGGFLSPAGIDRAINSASLDLFNQLVKGYRETQAVPELLKNFRKNNSFATTSRIANVPGASSEILAVSTIIDTVQYPARIVSSDQEWISRSYEDMDMDPRDNNPRHFYKQTQDYVLNAASPVLQDLPTDFVREIKLFNKDAQNNLSEGDILSDLEFADRSISVIIPPEEKNPIARIVGDQIEFLPRPSGTDSYTYVLSYYQFPVPKRALIRHQGNDGSNIVEVEVYPDVANLRVYYIEEPTAGVFGFTQTNGVITHSPGTSTNLTWDHKAFNQIMTGALFYLGFTIKDGQAVQVAPGRDQLEAGKETLTARA